MKSWTEFGIYTGISSRCWTLDTSAVGGIFLGLVIDNGYSVDEEGGLKDPGDSEFPLSISPAVRFYSWQCNVTVSFVIGFAYK